MSELCSTSAQLVEQFRRTVGLIEQPGVCLRVPQLLIGGGPGRSGTSSMAQLFAEQTHAAVSKEMRPILPWEVRDPCAKLKLAIARMEKLYIRAAHQPTVVISDTAISYLPFVPIMLAIDPCVRFVSITRDCSLVVQSWVARRGPNRWRVDITGDFRGTFPRYVDANRSLEDDVMRHCTEYHSETMNLMRTHPERVMEVNVSSLQPGQLQSKLLEFGRFIAHQQQPVHVNMRGRQWSSSSKMISWSRMSAPNLSFTEHHAHNLTFLQYAHEPLAYLKRDIEQRYVNENMKSKSLRRAERVERGATVVEAGAFRGFFTLKLAQLVGQTGKVVSIEPVKQNVEVLAKHVSVNGFEDRAIAMQYAVCDKDGTAKLYSTTSHHPRQTFFGEGTAKWAQFLGAVDREVNGVEAAVIDGAAALLRRDCPMVIAADRYMGEGRSELKDKLHTVFGYKQFKTLNGELFAEKCK
ncbi:MAG: hypothetical protein SGPRY_008212 [Prymnesium sp.]